MRGGEDIAHYTFANDEILVREIAFNTILEILA